MTSPSRRAHSLVVAKSDREGGVIPRITALITISLFLTGTRGEVLEFFEMYSHVIYSVIISSFESLIT